MVLPYSKVADRMANCVDPDQAASVGAVSSGSMLFAEIYLSENLGYCSSTLRKKKKKDVFTGFFFSTQTTEIYILAVIMLH